MTRDSQHSSRFLCRGQLLAYFIGMKLYMWMVLVATGFLMGMVGLFVLRKNPVEHQSEEVAVVTPSPEVVRHEPMRVSSQEAQTTKERRNIQIQLEAERRRMEQLQSDLEQVASVESSREASERYARGISERIRQTQALLSQRAMDDDLINETSQSYRRQQAMAKNQLQARIEGQIQSINASITSLQNQIRDLQRAQGLTTLTSDIPQRVQRLELEIAQLQTRRSQLESQARTLDIEADNLALGVSEATRITREHAQLERAELRQALEDMQAELDFWRKRSASGENETTRAQRIRTLRAEIEEQERKIERLQSRLPDASELEQ